MIRKILLLGALGAAGLTLAGCGPSSGILATAKTGDCFNVTGKDAMGQPKLIHSDCPAAPAPGQSTLPPADQAAAGDAAKGASAATASATSSPALPATTPVKADAKAVCQPAAPACAVPTEAVVHRGRGHVATGHAIHAVHVAAGSRYTHALNSRRVWRTHKVLRHRHGHTYTETVTEYVPASGEVTIGAPYTANTELSGGSSEGAYVLRDHPVYTPPAYGPPPPPPPPPPSADARRYDHRDDRRAYDSRSYSGSQSYGSQSYSSQSYSSSQRTAPPPPRPCNCTVQRPPAPAYEPDGYLTWPNKSQY